MNGRFARKAGFTAMLLTLTAVAAGAQTLNVVVGEVTYQVPAAEAGEMVYAGGSTLTIMGKTFALSDIDRMYVDDSEVTDDAISVSYQGEAAAVTVAANCMSHVTVTAKGAAVSIVQDDGLADEITYTLSGTSDNGSFYMDGRLKATVVLDNLTLTSADSAAINIDNGKRINLVLQGTSTLKDSSQSDGKGVLMVNGHSEVSGSGTLNLYGYAKHAWWADEYIQLKKGFTGSVNILYAKKDGINVNQYYEQNGGTMNISGVLDDGLQVSADDDEPGYVNLQGGSLAISVTEAATKGIKADGNITVNESKNALTVRVTSGGKGAWDSDDNEVKGSACISSDANVTIAGGTLSLSATGSGGKGLKCDSVLTITGGTLTVSTTGKQYVKTGASGTEYDGTYTGQIDRLNDAYHSSPKGIKVGIKAADNGGTAVGAVVISGGTVSVTVSGQQDGGEGIESKNTLDISGGEVTVEAYDDAINSASDLTISGGRVYARGTNNDGIDANGNCYIKGGLVYAIGSSAPEVAIDANTEDRKQLYVSGGTLVAIGGLESGASLTQACYASQSWTRNTWYALTVGNSVFAFQTPQSAGSTLVVSGASTPSLKSGVTVTAGTSVFNAKGYVDATVSGGSTVSLSSYSAGQQGGGGGNRPGGGGGPGGRF